MIQGARLQPLFPSRSHDVPTLERIFLKVNYRINLYGSSFSLKTRKFTQNLINRLFCWPLREFFSMYRLFTFVSRSFSRDRDIASQTAVCWWEAVLWRKIIVCNLIESLQVSRYIRRLVAIWAFFFVMKWDELKISNRKTILSYAEAGRKYKWKISTSSYPFLINVIVYAEPFPYLFLTLKNLLLILNRRIWGG